MSKHVYTTIDEEEVYVLYYEGKPLYIQKTRWYDWTPPKKVYFTIGAAKNGIHQLPDHVDKSKITIVKYVPEQNRGLVTV